jgi:hypothetical protein
MDPEEIERQRFIDDLRYQRKNVRGTAAFIVILVALAIIRLAFLTWRPGQRHRPLRPCAADTPRSGKTYSAIQ